MSESQKKTQVSQSNTQGESNDILSLAKKLPAIGEFPVKLETMMESLRYAEYEFTSGLGEIIDNSVQSGAKNIWILTKNEKKEFKGKNVEVLDEIAVIDNGIGMETEILQKCLILGEHCHPPKPGGALGIGKFGVGLTLGGISLARRIEVYSRDMKKEPFQFTCLDLDRIKNGNKNIPRPQTKEPPKEYTTRLDDQSGTIVILKNCDRLQFDPVEGRGIPASEQTADLSYYLGRTYRKFIHGGLQMSLNEKPIYLHDPLFLLGPTMFDMKDPSKGDPKADQWGVTDKIELDIPDQPGKKAAVTITMSLLPHEWRKRQNDGGRPHAKERHIPDNEGVSILRADREVLYDKVPYIIGKRGQARFEEIDRWWGCEISFPPELDSYFHVRYIKRGAEPISSLRDKIRNEIGRVVESLRDQIRKGFEKTETNQEKEAGVFHAAEKAMADADKVLPRGKAGLDMSEEKADKELERVASEAVDQPETSKEKKKDELKNRPYSILPVKYPQNIFFETEHLMGLIIVKLNINHPFYKDIFEPLCGTVETMSEESDVFEGAITPQQRRARNAFMLLLLSYAKAESHFDADSELLGNLRSEWGVTLATAIRKLKENE